MPEPYRRAAKGSACSYSPRRRATQASADDAWHDDVLGLRGELLLAERWRLGWYADVDAGGSDLSWQVSASLAYQFGWGTLVGDWRHLYVDYEQSNMRLDAAVTGPLIGADFRF